MTAAHPTKAVRGNLRRRDELHELFDDLFELPELDGSRLTITLAAAAHPQVDLQRLFDEVKTTPTPAMN